MQESMDRSVPIFEKERKGMADSFTQYDYDESIERAQALIDGAKAEKKVIEPLDLGSLNIQKSYYNDFLDEIITTGSAGKNAAKAMSDGNPNLCIIYTKELLKSSERLTSLHKVNLKTQ